MFDLERLADRRRYLASTTFLEMVAAVFEYRDSSLGDSRHELAGDLRLDQSVVSGMKRDDWHREARGEAALFGEVHRSDDLYLQGELVSISRFG